MSRKPPTREQLDEMIALGAATLFHGAGEFGAVDAAIAPIASGMKLAGPVLTVDLPPGDNLALHLAISTAQPGTVLVVDYKQHMEAAAMGDIMALASKIRGITGMAIDGAVREVEAIAEMGFATFARGRAIRGPTKDKRGAVGTPITFGGIGVKSGDIIIGDTDGIVVLAESRWPQALKNATRRENQENAMRQQLSEGRTTVELLDLEPALNRHAMH